MPSSAPTLAPRRARVVGGTLLLGSGVMLPAALTGALAVRMQADLGVGEAWIGGAVSAFFVGGGLAGIAVSRRVDRRGWRRSSTEAAVACGVALLSIALWGRAAWVLIAAMVVAGIAFTMQVPSGNLAVSQEVPAHRLGSTLGLTQTATPLAMLLAGIAVPTIALTLDWRTVFAVAVAWPLLGAMALPWQRVTAGAARASAPPVPVDDARTIGVASFFASFIPGSLTAFFVVAAVASGLSEAAAGVLLAVCSASGLLVRATAGVLADRSGTDGYRPVACMLLVGAVGVSVLAVGHPVATAIGGLLAFTGGWGWPGLWFYALVRSHVGAAGAVTGAVQAGGMIGSAAGPLAFGLLTQVASVRVSWLATASVTVLAGVLVLRAAPSGEEVVARCGS